MKKYFSIMIILLTLLSACTSTAEPASETPSPIESISPPTAETTEHSEVPVPDGIDRTADLSGYFPFTPDLDEAEIITLSPNIDLQPILLNSEQLCEGGEHIVIGKVTETYYVDVAGLDRVYYDFQLEEVLKGDLGAGDTITVVRSGGYVRGNVFAELNGFVPLQYFDNTQQLTLTNKHLLRWDYGIQTLVPGERYALFLVPKVYLDGVYGESSGMSGIYRIDGEAVNYLFSEFLDNSSDLLSITTLSELRTTVEKNVVQSLAPDSSAPGSAYSPAGVNRTADLSGIDTFILPENVTEVQLFYQDNIEYMPHRTVGELCRVAETIIVGEVMDILYTDEDFYERIFLNVKSLETIRGGLTAGDIVTVQRVGGYIRGSIWAAEYGENSLGEIPLSDDYMIRRDMFNDIPYPKVGDKYVLFLCQSNSLDGAYDAFGYNRLSFTSFYVDGEIITQVFPEAQKQFFASSGVTSLQQLREYVTHIPRAITA